MSYAAVFPLVRTRAFAGAFDYSVPPELEGTARARARSSPSRSAPRPSSAWSSSCAATTAHEGRVLPVRDLLDVPAIPADLLELAREVESYYLTSFSAASVARVPADRRPQGRAPVRAHGRRAGRPRGRRGGLDEVAGLKLPAGPLTKLGERYRRKGWVRIAYRVHVAGATPAGRALRRGGETPPRLGPRQRAALELSSSPASLDERALRAADGPLAAGAASGCSRPARSSRCAAPGTPRGAGGGASRGGAGRSAPPRAGRPPAGLRHSATRPTCCPSSAPRCTPSSARRAPATRCSCTASPAAARPRCTCRPPRPRWRAAARCCCWCPRSGSPGRRWRACASASPAHEVAVLHSGLTAARAAARLSRRRRAARCASWSARARRCSRRCGDLGLIVVDEEHDTSYKQESEPAYDARTVARWRAARSGAVVVLGSATPSVESFARVPLHADLRRRVDGSQPPALEIVDMRDHHGVLLAAAGRGAHGDHRRRRQGDPLPQPPRLRLVPASATTAATRGCARTAT